LWLAAVGVLGAGRFCGWRWRPPATGRLHGRGESRRGIRSCRSKIVPAVVVLAILGEPGCPARAGGSDRALRCRRTPRCCGRGGAAGAVGGRRGPGRSSSCDVWLAVKVGMWGWRSYSHPLPSTAAPLFEQSGSKTGSPAPWHARLPRPTTVISAVAAPARATPLPQGARGSCPIPRPALLSRRRGQQLTFLRRRARHGRSVPAGTYRHAGSQPMAGAWSRTARFPRSGAAACGVACR